MAKNGVNVFLVTTKGRPHGFTFAVSAADSGNAIKILTDEFGPELSRGEVENISASYKLATIAVVGSKMRNNPTLTPVLTTMLAEAGIRVYATSDGTSDSTIAFVVGADRSDEAIRLLHDRLFDKKD